MTQREREREREREGGGRGVADLTMFDNGRFHISDTLFLKYAYKIFNLPISQAERKTSWILISWLFQDILAQNGNG